MKERIVATSNSVLVYFVFNWLKPTFYSMAIGVVMYGNYLQKLPVLGGMNQMVMFVLVCEAIFFIPCFDFDRMIYGLIFDFDRKEVEFQLVTTKSHIVKFDDIKMVVDLPPDGSFLNNAGRIDFLCKNGNAFFYSLYPRYYAPYHIMRPSLAQALAKANIPFVSREDLPEYKRKYFRRNKY